MSKITSIEQAESPIDPEVILQRLQEVQPDIAHEYINAISENVDRELFWRSIVYSAGNPRICKHLIDSLSEDQLKNLNTISLYLSAEDPLKFIDELRNITFGMQDEPTFESYAKAFAFIDLIKSREIDCDAASLRLADLYRHIRLLTDILAIAARGSEYDEILIEKLSKMFPEDIDSLMNLIGSEVDLKANL